MSTADLQRRVLLETACSRVARELATGWESSAAFLLFMADLGEEGFIASAGTGDSAEGRAAVERWVKAGGRCDQVHIRVASDEEARERKARVMAATRGLAEWIAKRCLPGTGFAILVFNGAKTITYVSNVDREDVMAVLAGWVERKPRSCRREPPPASALN